MTNFPIDFFQKYGPLIYFSNMRYERKHKYFKKLSEEINNWINITKSLCIRHERLFATKTSQLIFDHTSLKKLNDYEISLLESMNIINEKYSKIKEIIYENIELMQNGIYFKEFKNGKYFINKIKLIVIEEKKVKIISELNEGIFIDNYFLFQLKPIQCNIFDVKSHCYFPKHSLLEYDKKNFVTKKIILENY